MSVMAVSRPWLCGVWVTSDQTAVSVVAVKEGTWGFRRSWAALLTVKLGFGHLNGGGSLTLTRSTMSITSVSARVGVSRVGSVSRSHRRRLRLVAVRANEETSSSSDDVKQLDALIIGGGPAGLAAALMLKSRGYVALQMFRVKGWGPRRHEGVHQGGPPGSVLAGLSLRFGSVACGLGFERPLGTQRIGSARWHPRKPWSMQ